jgi:transposase InsO family protein
MEGHSVSLGGQKALETLPRNEQGELLVRPEIRSDNGSGFISKEFHGVLAHYGLTHVKITPHCPEENGLVERSNRTVRDEVDPKSWTGGGRELKRARVALRAVQSWV